MTSSNGAEAEVRAAEARAAAARARVDELRSRLENVTDPEATEIAAGTTDIADAGATPAAVPPVSAPPRRGRPLALATAAAAAVSTALLAATGYMVWQHWQSTQQTQRAAEYAAVARQGVVNLMDINFETADDSVKRVLDGSTGSFHDSFADSVEDFVKALKDEKIVTKATVNTAAVEKMTKDSAVVMVSATSHREGAKAPKDQQQPRLWRIVVNLQRDGDRVKMSGVEFV